MNNNKLNKVEIIMSVGIGLITLGLVILCVLFAVESSLYFDECWYAVILAEIGLWLVCGALTMILMPNKQSSFILGFLLGVIGVIIAFCMKTQENTQSISKTSDSEDKYENLEKLMKLKESGILTDVEFEVEKAKLLK